MMRYNSDTSSAECPSRQLTQPQGTLLPGAATPKHGHGYGDTRHGAPSSGFERVTDPFRSSSLPKEVARPEVIKPASCWGDQGRMHRCTLPFSKPALHYQISISAVPSPHLLIF